MIRAIPKPVIAAVNGFAIGGGHVLHVLCDLSIASESARFGQVGPRVGSFDAGFGSAYLARVVGEKRAREIWFLCEQYDATTAERWGLVNRVVPAEKLMSTAMEWAKKVVALSPTAIKALKHSFNADSDHIMGIQSLAFDVLDLYTETDESKEGGKAFTEKRPPDFSPYR
jgi:naphthoate synthase